MIAGAPRPRPAPWLLPRVTNVRAPILASVRSPAQVISVANAGLRTSKVALADAYAENQKLALVRST